MVVDEKSTGPYTLDQITLHPKLTPESLVWKPGLDNWIAAKTLPELAPAFINQESQQGPPDFNGSNDFNNNREFQNHGGDHYNPYNNYSNNGREPFSGDNPYADNSRNPFANNPQYQQGHSYHNHNRYYENKNRYQNDYRPNIRTNWLPWAIVATIVGFFASCIGAIFGIIGIVQANKANTLYAQGFDREAEAANSNAKIMTIIGLIFAGIGIIAAIWFGSIFSSLSNYPYI